MKLPDGSIAAWWKDGADDVVLTVPAVDRFLIGVVQRFNKTQNEVNFLNPFCSVM